MQQMHEDERTAYVYALRLLSRREYCRKRICDRLDKKGYASECVASVCERLKLEGYLSEERFAEYYLRNRLAKGDAPWLAAARARKYGVAAEAVECVLAELTGSYNAETACTHVLHKRDPGGLRFTDERQWRRLARYLRNKGFDTATILRVMKKGNDLEE